MDSGRHSSTSADEVYSSLSEKPLASSIRSEYRLATPLSDLEDATLLEETDCSTAESSGNSLET